VAEPTNADTLAVLARVQHLLNRPPAGTLDAENERLRAELAERDATIATLRGRLELADAQLAIHENTKLGATRATAAALTKLFRYDPPAAPEQRESHRVPLAKLADMTGLSPDACSRHVKTLARYTKPDGAPVLHAKVTTVPECVNVDTGELVPLHRELWLGPAGDARDFGRVLAALAPDERKPHGGRADRAGTCPAHPHAAVIRRTTVVCAECGCRVAPDIVSEQQGATPMPHDAGLGAEAAAPSPATECQRAPLNWHHAASTYLGGQDTLAGRVISMPHDASLADAGAERAAALAAWQRGRAPTTDAHDSAVSDCPLLPGFGAGTESGGAAGMDRWTL
jgi:hypothetical protein